MRMKPERGRRLASRLLYSDRPRDSRIVRRLDGFRRRFFAERRIYDVKCKTGFCTPSCLIHKTSFTRKAPDKNVLDERKCDISVLNITRLRGSPYIIQHKRTTIRNVHPQPRQNTEIIRAEDRASLQSLLLISRSQLHSKFHDVEHVVILGIHTIATRLDSSWYNLAVLAIFFFFRLFRSFMRLIRAG